MTSTDGSHDIDRWIAIHREPSAAPQPVRTLDTLSRSRSRVRASRLQACNIAHRVEPAAHAHPTDDQRPPRPSVGHLPACNYVPRRAHRRLPEKVVEWFKAAVLKSARNGPWVSNLTSSAKDATRRASSPVTSMTGTHLGGRWPLSRRIIRYTRTICRISRPASLRSRVYATESSRISLLGAGTACGLNTS
jgi:hypothetical protein